MGSARAKAAEASSGAAIRATGTPKSRPASSISAKHGPLARKARQAPAAISAPIPAGSPMVRISGFMGYF
jgi:hypothetical protein